MGREAANTLQVPVQTACRDILVPSFEQACGAMMQQVNATFQRGTQECTNVHPPVHDHTLKPIDSQLVSRCAMLMINMSSFRSPLFKTNCYRSLYSCTDSQQLESHLEQVRRRHDQSRDPIVQQMTSLVESCRYCQIACIFLLRMFMSHVQCVYTHVYILHKNCQDSSVT